MIKKNKAIFLDRDGVLNKEKSDYVKIPSELELFSYIGKCIKKIHELGFLAIVITNQSAVNRGLTTHENINLIHKEIQQNLKKFGTKIDAFYYCPHTPKEFCSCRKPKTGLFDKAISDWNIDISLSWFIGDSQSDIEAGNLIGTKNILITKETNLENCIYEIISK